MLSIRAIGSSAQQVAYYADLGEAENHDYYASERPGQWWGSGVAALGLSGPVVATEFGNLLRGYSADGQNRLVQNAGQSRRRSAFDLTWSVPKSVSVLWSQVNHKQQKEIEKCAERALNRVLKALDDFCAATRRGHNGTNQERAKLIGAIFRHDTSRGMPGEVPDPNLHFHVVLANISVREDGTTGALDARPLFRKNMKMALGALFRAELSKELGELGLKTYRPTRSERRNEFVSWFELSAVPKQLLESMSKRRAAIEKWLAKRGLSGAKSAEQAALSTREVKQTFTWEALRNKWNELGQQFGFSRPEAELAFQNEKGQQLDPIDEAKQATLRALDRLMNDQATFTELDLLRLTAEESQTHGVGITQICQVVSDLLQHSTEIVRLKERKGEAQFTTQTMLNMEAAMLRAAATLHQRDHHTLSYSQANQMILKHQTLRNEQRDALRHLLVGSDLACVNGIAGSGKTYMLAIAKQAWEADGQRVIGTALAAKAAQGLEEGAGIRSKHIHKLLKDIEQGKESIDRHTIILVDEAGMVGTHQMHQLTELASQRGAKLVLVGDHRQLQAVSAGAPFRVIGERLGNVELEEIIRQRQAWAREAVHDFRAGRAERALQSFVDRGLFCLTDDREEAMGELVADWFRHTQSESALKENLIVAGTNFEVRELNRLCQSQRQMTGPAVTLNGLEFHSGDRVLVTRNHNPLLISNGMLGTVTNIDEATATLRVRFDNGYQVNIDTRHFQDLTLGYAITTHKAQGVTCENNFVLLGQMNDRELSYVQSSRARGETRLYADMLSSGEVLGDIANQLNESHIKDLAHEHLRDIA